jgi:hypothetical protein
MDKTEYEIAREHEREAIKGMLRERDRKLVRCVLQQLQEIGALVDADESEGVKEGAVEEFCEIFWRDELDM